MRLHKHEDLDIRQEARPSTEPVLPCMGYIISSGSWYVQLWRYRWYSWFE